MNRLVKLLDTPAALNKIVATTLCSGMGYMFYSTSKRLDKMENNHLYHIEKDMEIMRKDINHIKKDINELKTESQRINTRLDDIFSLLSKKK